MFLVGVGAQPTDRVCAAGETVAERQGPDNPGKAQAIDRFLQRTEFSAYNAAALIDADNLVDPLYLREINRLLETGARVLQFYDGIANPDDSVIMCMLTVTYRSPEWLE